MPDAGEVVLVDFPGAVGTKRRPVLVLSSSAYHSTRPDVILGLITGQTAKSAGPTDHVLNDWSAAGLHQPSAFRAFFVTIASRDLHGVIGKLSTADWAAVQTCLRSALVVT